MLPRADLGRDGFYAAKLGSGVQWALSCVMKLLGKVAPSMFIDCFECGREQLESNSLPYPNVLPLVARHSDESSSTNISCLKFGTIHEDEIESAIEELLAIDKGESFCTVFWEYGEKLNKPALFCQMWHVLLATRNDYDVSFVFYEGFLDLLFDHFALFVDVNPVATIISQTDIRIQLIDLMVNVLLKYWDQLSLNTRHASFIWMRLFKFLNYSSDSVQVEIFRNVARLHYGLRMLTGQSDAKVRINKMMELLSPDAFIFRNAIQLAVETIQSGSMHVIIAMYVLKVHCVDQNDLALIEKIIMTASPKNPLCVIQTLLLQVTEMKILARSIIKTVSKVMYRFRKIKELREWMSMYIKKSFMFLYALDSTQKYIWKRHIIFRMILALNKLKIFWLSKMIRGNAGCCLELGKCRSLFGTKLSKNNIDYSILLSYKNLLKKGKDPPKNPYFGLSVNYPE